MKGKSSFNTSWRPRGGAQV